MCSRYRYYQKKYNSDYPLQGIIRQEHVTLQNVEITQLYDLIKKYLQQLKLDIIHVEVMIRGNEGNYDLILRTGAWGKDIIVPTAIAGVLTAGVAAIPVAAVSGYRAHSFENNFWNSIKKTLSEIGKANATMSEPVTVTH
jgi:hypothetical protein